MKFELVRKFSFDSAHYMPYASDKCKEVHGHTYFLEVFVESESEYLKNGLALGVKELKDLVNNNVISHFDHKLINDVIDNPTMENITLWIKDQLIPLLNTKEYRLRKLRLWETPNNSVILHCDG